MTLAPRFPLLIDPQEQAASWIKKRERNIEGKCLTLEKIIEDHSGLIKTMEDGDIYLIEDMDETLPPILEQVLDSPFGKFEKRATQIYIKDTKVLVDEKFTLYMTTKLTNPHFSPELSSKISIIDFTMSQEALELTLLSKVIAREQRSVEEQLGIHLNNINTHKMALKEISKTILITIASSEGSLLENDKQVDELNKEKKIGRASCRERVSSPV